MTSRKSHKSTTPAAKSTASARPAYSAQSSTDLMNQHLENFRQKTNQPEATTNDYFGAVDKGTYDPIQEQANAMLMPIHNDVPPPQDKS